HLAVVAPLRAHGGQSLSARCWGGDPLRTESPGTRHPASPVGATNHAHAGGAASPWDDGRCHLGAAAAAILGIRLQRSADRSSTLAHGRTPRVVLDGAS